MPRDERMFGDVVDPSIKLGNNQGKSVGMTILIETTVIAAMVIIPLMATDVPNLSSTAPSDEVSFCC